MSSSLSFMHDVPKSTIECLIYGFCRRLTNDNTSAPTDIIGVILLFFNPVIRWRLSIDEITTKLDIDTTKLDTDTTTIDGPTLNLNGYNFMLKLKKSRENLYFGAWYQCNDIIHEAIHSYFQSIFNHQIANKIKASFKFIIEDEEFDDVQLILHDMSDPSYSCILEYIESELLSYPLLRSFGNVTTSIANIKQNLIRILSSYKPGSGSQASSFTFRVRFYCHETDEEFKKLYKFETNQVGEKGAELYWRNKYNNYKDHTLDFGDTIKLMADKELKHLTYDCYMELIDNFNQDQDDSKERELYYECKIDEELKHKLKIMGHGDHIYLPGHFGEHERFAVFIGCYHRQYDIYLQQLYPYKSGNKHKVIKVTMGSIKLDLYGISNGRGNVGNVRSSDEDDHDIELICKFKRDILLTQDQALYLKIYLRQD